MPVGRQKAKKPGETFSIQCPECDGSGKSEVGKECETCRGTKTVQATATKKRGF